MKSFKKGVVALILLLLVLTACSDNAEQEQSIEEDNVEVEVPEQEEEPEVIEEIVLQHTESDIDFVKGIMEDGFEGMFDVDYEEEVNSFTLRISDEDLILAVIKTVTGEYDRYIWEDLFDSIAVLSQTVAVRLNDPEVFVIIVNPLDGKQALLITQNGEVLYDFFEEFEKYEESL